MNIDINYKLLGLDWTLKIQVKKIDGYYYCRLSDNPEVEYIYDESTFFVILKDKVNSLINKDSIPNGETTS